LHETLIAFLVFRGFISLFLKRGQTFHHLVYHPLLYYDVSPHEVVELVVVIPTSPRSSKTESGCSSYCRFHFGVSASFGGPKKAGPGPKNVGPLALSSGATCQQGGQMFGRKKSNSGPEKAGVGPEKGGPRPEKGGLSCPNGHISRRGYKYPFFLLDLATNWVLLTSIVDFESLPSLLHSSHDSCISFREKREEI
jgi:hypothetical protein